MKPPELSPTKPGVWNVQPDGMPVLRYGEAWGVAVRSSAKSHVESQQPMPNEYDWVFTTDATPPTGYTDLAPNQLEKQPPLAFSYAAVALQSLRTVRSRRRPTN